MQVKTNLSAALAAGCQFTNSGLQKSLQLSLIKRETIRAAFFYIGILIP